MLKEMIRQLASSAEGFTNTCSGQMQLAGISVEEQNALLGELNEQEGQTSFFGYGWN